MFEIQLLGLRSTCPSDVQTATGSCSDTLTIVSDVCQKAFSENLVNAAFGFLVGAASQDFTGTGVIGAGLLCT